MLLVDDVKLYSSVIRRLLDHFLGSGSIESHRDTGLRLGDTTTR